MQITIFIFGKKKPLHFCYVCVVMLFAYEFT